MELEQILPKLLIGALGLVMFGLGLSLAIDDFRRLLKHPKAVVLALVLQVVMLPAVCYGIAVAFELPPLLAIGIMLLAASPGGVSANLFSHLFGGNVAMNISLTAINTLLSIVSMPLIGTWAIEAFAGTGQVVPPQFGKLIEIVLVVLLPAMAGMVVAAKKPDLARRLEKPFKIFSMLVLVAFSLIAFSKESEALVNSFASVGPAVLVFNLVSLLSGYYVSRWAGLQKDIATAIGYEIGIHNSTLAIYLAITVLNLPVAALPAAIYAVTMYVTATVFGLTVLRRTQGPAFADSAALRSGAQ